MERDKQHELFVAHYHETKDKIFTYLMYRLRFDRATCEDLLMDIVLKAYENFERFDPKKGSFKSWIFRIAHNHLVNYWRDHKEELPIEQAENVADESAPDNPFSSAIHKILNLLSDAERQIITLRYLNDLSFEEIADVTGKGQGAVRTSLSRALNQFKTLYNKFYEEPHE